MSDLVGELCHFEGVELLDSEKVEFQVEIRDRFRSSTVANSSDGVILDDLSSSCDVFVTSAPHCYPDRDQEHFVGFDVDESIILKNEDLSD